MSDQAKLFWKTLAALIPAVGGILVLVWVAAYVIAGSGVNRWQMLGMVAVAMLIAFAAVALLRFALSPLLSPQPATASGANVDADAAVRGRIAPLVLAIGSGAIVALAVALIVTFAVLHADAAISTKLDTLLTGVFGSVLPVVSTWVGTVLAFYFGSENFRQAAQSTRDAIGAQAAAAKKVTDVMIPFERIARLEANDAADAAAKTMLDVIQTMSAAAPRIIVFNRNDQTPIFVIRSNTPPMPDGWVTGNYAAGGSLPPNAHIQQYLDANGGANRADALKFRFINVNASVSDAVALMKKEGVDDLFVTNDGQASRVLGWAALKDLLGA